jgi:hypothetical protein
MKLKPNKIRKIGWFFFAVFWIPFITLFIGMWGMPSGSYDFSEMPKLSQYSLIAMGVLFFLIFLFFIGGIALGRFNRVNLISDGKRAVATITRIYETGTTVNVSYVIGFDLEVTPTTSRKFKTTTEQLVPRLDIHKYKVGQQVEVAYDPKSHTATIIGLLPKK